MITFSKAKIDNIIKESDGRILKIVPANYEITEIVKNNEAGSYTYYDAFVAVLNDSTELARYTTGIETLMSSYPELSSSYVAEESGILYRFEMNRRELISIKDISSMSEQDQVENLHFALLTARHTHFIPDRHFAFNSRLFRLDEQRVVCIISILQIYSSNESIYLKTLFPSKDVLSYAQESSVSDSRIASLAYWKDKLRHITESDVHPRTSHTIKSEIITLPKELSDTINMFLTKGNIDIRTLFMTTWHIIIGRQLDTSCPTLACSTEHGKLEYALITSNISNDLVTVFNDITMQFNGADTNDACTISDIMSSTNLDVSRIIPFIQNYSQISTTSSFIDRVKKGGIYQLRPIKGDLADLSVTYILAHSSIRIKYDYNPHILQGASIDSVHNAFIDALSSIIEPLARILMPAEHVLVGKTAPVKVSEDTIKYEVLNRCQLFGCLSETELRDLSNRSYYLNMFADAPILSSDEIADMMYVIAEGKVDLYQTEDSTEKSLGILSAGKVFGIECLTRKPISHVSYRVCSPTARIIAIQSNLLKQLANNHPEIYQDLLLIQSDNVSKYQRLWLME